MKTYNKIRAQQRQALISNILYNIYLLHFKCFYFFYNKINNYI